MIEPFANNHQSMQIGELVIENQTDKIVMYGDIDIGLNVAGYEQAKQLYELTGNIINAFESRIQAHDLPDNNSIKNEQSDNAVDNPFL